MSALGNTAQQQVYQPAIDYFSGNGATSQFTLSRPVASVAQIIVSVANVIQNPNTFSVNNNILTLGGNAPVGTNNVWVQYQTAVIQVNQPGQGTVGTNQLMDSTVTQKKLATGVGNQVGEVSFFAMSAAPSGWIKANGAAVSRTAYADLYAAIGTTFGTGDGSTTFNLPDLRGEFPRGLDDGRGIDSGRTIGSAQQDQFQGHFHDLMRDGTGSYTNAINLSLAKTDSYDAGGWLGNSYTAGYRGRYLSDNTNGTPRLGSETRPRNVALLACIKY